MKRIAVANMKGGVGKTTTSIIISDLVSRILGQRVLALDLDPQANMSWALLSPISFQEVQPEQTLTHWLKQLSTGGTDQFANSFADAGLFSNNLLGPNLNDRAVLKLAVANTKLRFEEMSFDGPTETEQHRRLEKAFRSALAVMEASFDVCVFDCSPSLSALTLVGLKAADAIIVPTPLNLLCYESLVTFKKRALDELLSLDKPIFVLRTRVSRSNGDAEKAQVTTLLKQGQKDGYWKILEPPLAERVEYTRALNPPALGPYTTLNSKYGSRVADLRRLATDLTEKGIINGEA